MIANLTVMNLQTRKIVSIDTAEDTPKTAFEKAGIDPASGSMMLNGIPVTAGDFNLTFDRLGHSGGTLSSIVKADSAA